MSLPQRKRRSSALLPYFMLHTEKFKANQKLADKHELGCKLTGALIGIFIFCSFSFHVAAMLSRPDHKIFYIFATENREKCELFAANMLESIKFVAYFFRLAASLHYEGI